MASPARPWPALLKRQEIAGQISYIQGTIRSWRGQRLLPGKHVSHGQARRNRIRLPIAPFWSWVPTDCPNKPNRSNMWATQQMKAMVMESVKILYFRYLISLVRCQMQTQHKIKLKGYLKFFLRAQFPHADNPVRSSLWSVFTTAPPSVTSLQLMYYVARRGNSRHGNDLFFGSVGRSLLDPRVAKRYETVLGQNYGDDIFLSYVSW